LRCNVRVERARRFLARPLSNTQLGGNAELTLKGDTLLQGLAYRPTTISTPAAMARIAITVP